MIEDFFLWKLESIHNKRLYNAWQSAINIIQAQFWTFQQLKEMSDRDSSIYRTAVKDLHIPKGIATSFRAELARYKKATREITEKTTKEAAEVLSSLLQG